MRVPSEQITCVQATVDGVTYTARDGYFNMRDDHAEKWIKATGERPVVTGARKRSLGFRCLACGFGSWFSTCSRCGEEAVRESD